MIRWILPYPLLSLSLFIMWLLLQQSVAPGHVVMAVIMAFIGGRVMVSLKPEKLRMRLGFSVIKLFWIVLQDIVRSNIAVARIVLSGRRPEGHVSSFITLPLALTNRYGLAVLAIIITSTPGTLWMQHNQNRRTLQIHVLDLVDEQEWIDLIKTRYERLLLEIFP